jgi:hypothetical protein
MTKALPGKPTAPAIFRNMRVTQGEKPNRSIVLGIMSAEEYGKFQKYLEQRTHHKETSVSLK